MKIEITEFEAKLLRHALSVAQYSGMLYTDSSSEPPREPAAVDEAVASLKERLSTDYVMQNWEE